MCYRTAFAKQIVPIYKEGRKCAGSEKPGDLGMRACDEIFDIQSGSYV